MPLPLPLPGQSGHHAVQFYSDDGRLCSSVADFLGDGIAAGQPLLLVVTPKHRDAILAELRSRHFDVDALIRRNDLTVLDVAETLKRFMVDGRPNAGQFDAVARPVIEGILRGRTDCVIRTFGEMVDALWRADNPEGAIQLELLWDQLSKRYPFSLLCAYRLNHVCTDAGAVQRICAHHTHHEVLSGANA